MALGKFLGVITEVLPVESGNKQNGGTWMRQQFIVKKIEDGAYEHFVALTISGERIQKIAPAVGKVGWFVYDVESNKGKEGRWFTSAVCVRHDAVDVSAAAPAPAPVQQGGYQQSAPAYQPAPVQQPAYVGYQQGGYQQPQGGMMNPNDNPPF